MTRARAGCIIATLAMPWLAPAIGGSAYGQVGADNAAGSINLGAHGAIGAEAPVRTSPTQDRPDSPVEFNVRAGLASDYIYRGTSLSARQPAVGAALEAAFGMFYGGGTITSVRLPSQPGAEISTSGGLRPKGGGVQFDFCATSFLYPGEAAPSGV